MKVSYFEDTDTLYIEFRAGDVVETRDLDENTVLDMDADGHIYAMTFEHASQRTDVKHLVVEGIAAYRTSVAQFTEKHAALWTLSGDSTPISLGTDCLAAANDAGTPEGTPVNLPIAHLLSIPAGHQIMSLGRAAEK
jgi:uncharacterized protein YuzE